MEAKYTSKLDLKTKLSYGMGQMTDSISANVFVFFFIYFLTDIAGIAPATAGLVSLIAVGWDAVTDPVIGYLSDNLKSKYGRRRPMILLSAIPLGIALWLMFTVVEFQGSAKTMYYVLTAMFYYTAYTCYYVPYMTLGGEMVTDFNERTSVRYYCLGFQLIGVFIASSGTMLVVDYFAGMTGSLEVAWSMTAATFGAFSAIAGIISWRFTRGKEPMPKIEETPEKGSFLRTLKSAASIKSIQILSLAVVVYAIGFSISMGMLIYLMNDLMVLEGSKQVIFWTFNSFIGLVLVPVANIIGMKIGKKKAYISIIGLAALVQISFFFFGFKFIGLLVFATFLCLGHNAYFGLFQSMMYDCCEVFEYVTGQKKQGAVISIVFLFQKIGFAVGMWLMGLIMESFGYIGTVAVQSQSAIYGIKLLTAGIAPGFYLASAICIILYKLDEKTFEKLQEAIVRKKEEGIHDKDLLSDIA